MTETAAVHEVPPAMTPRPIDRPRAPEPCWDGDTAIRLLIATTTAGQLVVDLDRDPLLRAAAATTGRRYRPIPLTPARPDGRAAIATHVVTRSSAGLICLRWPRPHLAQMPGSGRRLFTVLTRALDPGGHLAVLLPAAPMESFTITWTGALLAAMADAGLTYLQDVVCLHDKTGLHRVVLIVRCRR